MSQMYRFTFIEQLLDNERYKDMFVLADNAEQAQAYAAEVLADYYNSVTDRENNPDDYEGEIEDEVRGIIIPDELGYIYNPDGSACVKLGRCVAVTEKPSQFHDIRAKSKEKHPTQGNTEYGLLQIKIEPGNVAGYYTEDNLTITRASVVGDWLSDFAETYGCTSIVRHVFANAPGKLPWLYNLPCTHATVAIQINNAYIPPCGIMYFKYLGHVDLPALLEDVLDNLAYEEQEGQEEQPAKQELVTTYFASYQDSNSFGPGCPTVEEAIESAIDPEREPEYVAIIEVKAPAGVYVEADLYEIEADDLYGNEDDD